MEKMEWYEDDRPRDYTPYTSMTKEELDAEIAKVEAEEKEKKRKPEAISA